MLVAVRGGVAAPFGRVCPDLCSAIYIIVECFASDTLHRKVLGDVFT